MRPIDADKIVLNYGGLIHISPLDGRAIAKYFYDQIQAMPTIAPPPNDPLTLEQLREMDGKPVWVSWDGHSSEGWALVRVWSKANSTIYLTYHNGATDLLEYILRNGAKVYRRRPEEATT